MIMRPPVTISCYADAQHSAGATAIPCYTIGIWRVCELPSRNWTFTTHAWLEIEAHTCSHIIDCSLHTRTSSDPYFLRILETWQETRQYRGLVSRPRDPEPSAARYCPSHSVAVAWSGQACCANRRLSVLRDDSARRRARNGALHAYRSQVQILEHVVAEDGASDTGRDEPGR